RTLVVATGVLAVLLAILAPIFAAQQGAHLKTKPAPCDSKYKKQTVPSNVLKEIIRAHEQWLEDREASGSRRGDLCQADLHGAKLAGANLERFRLEGADLRGATLHHSSLMQASLVGADLTNAKLEDAGLVGADLRQATLTHANL